MRMMLSVTILSAFLATVLVAGCTPSGEQTGTEGEKAAQQEPVKAAAPKASPASSPEAEEEADFLMVFADAEPEEGVAPLEVKFTADISGGAGQRKVEWDFGDGTTSSEVNPVHVYKKAGTYLATVQVSDSTGDEDDDDIEIIVEEPEGAESPAAGE